MHRLLKNTGSIYLHCDPTASHYLKMLMDVVFGAGNFRNEVVWCYKSGGVSKRYFARKHDILLFYAKDEKLYSFNVPKIKSYGQAGGGQGGAVKYYKDDGGTYSIVRPQGTGGKYQCFLPHTVSAWDTPRKSPLALLERIITASSNKDDVVLDPFAGCATACVAADRLQRQWVGIDLSPLAATLVKSRLQKDMKMFYEVHHREDIPRRTDLGDLPNYKTHRHTLYGRQEGTCGGCQVMFPFRNMTVDHIVPQSRGGNDHLDNLQLLCGACNSTKAG